MGLVWCFKREKRIMERVCLGKRCLEIKEKRRINRRGVREISMVLGMIYRIVNR